MAIWPSNQIVKVKVEPYEHSAYPFRVVSLEKNIAIGGVFSDGVSGFNIVDPMFIELYPSRKAGEKAELEKLHDQHLQEKIALSKQAKRVKAANKRISEYKAFKQIQTI
jgi:hypothetical protein